MGEVGECPKELTDYEVTKNLLRGLVFMRLEYEHSKYMWQVMKEFKRKPLESKGKEPNGTSTSYSDE